MLQIHGTMFEYFKITGKKCSWHLFLDNWIRSNLLRVAAPPQWSLMASIRSSSQRNCPVLIYSTPNTLFYTLSFNVSVLLLRAACKTSEIAAIFQNVNVWLSISCLFQTIGTLTEADRRGALSWLVQNVSQRIPQFHKCQQNVSNITQRHEYRLPSAAIKAVMY